MFSVFKYFVNLLLVDEFDSRIIFVLLAPVEIVQKATSSWVSNGKTFFRYSAIVTNKSGKSVKNFNLTISKLYGPLWGLTKTSDGSYGFPKWISSLPADKSIEFVYIHSAPFADVSVSSYTLT